MKGRSCDGLAAKGLMPILEDLRVYWVNTTNNVKYNQNSMSPVLPFSHMSYVYKFQGITRGCCSSSAFGEPADAYSNVFYHGCFRRWNSWASNFPKITYFSSQEEHIAV